MANVSSLSPFSALQYSPFGGRVGIYLLGRPHDWNISGDDSANVQHDLGWMAAELGIKRILAPRASTFNAKLCTARNLQERTLISRVEDDVLLCRGFDADGVVLLPEEADELGPAADNAECPKFKMAFWMSSADCITVIAHDPKTGMTIASHAGRDCLIDRSRINTKAAREHESVVNAIMELFPKAHRRDIQVFMTCGIGPENFSHPCDHPEHGQANMRMVLDISHKYGNDCLYGEPFEGRIVLSQVIRSQFMKLGVPSHRIAWDGIDTYSDLLPSTEYRWWSYRRGDGKKRNGVLVVRNW